MENQDLSSSPARSPDSLVADRLAAARAGDQREFGNLVEPYRRELRVHCYRMLGSLEDAEDLVQETLLRAWQRLNTYAGRASFRAWLYKIATNVCLDALARRPKRVLPQAKFPAADPAAPFAPPVSEPIWLEPFPDDLLAGVEAAPEARYDARESITLAFLAALQLLPPRQRAVLLLRDVFDWQAAEVAAMLELTVSAANSALHRARTTLAKHYAARGLETYGVTPSDETLRAQLDRYIQAWETADVEALVALLKEDATFTMPPLPSWYQGHAAIRAIVSAVAFGGAGPGQWRLLPTRANGQPACASYQLAESARVYKPFGITVLTFARGTHLLADVTTFINPGLFPRFGLPAQVQV